MSKSFSIDLNNFYSKTKKINNYKQLNDLKQYLFEVLHQVSGFGKEKIKSVKNTLFNKSIDEVQEYLDNPYLLIDIKGIGFKLCDRVAARLGKLGLVERYEEAIKYTLTEIANSEGWTIVDYFRFRKRISEVVDSEFNETKFTEGLNNLIKSNEVIYYKEVINNIEIIKVSLTIYYEYEKFILNNLQMKLKQVQDIELDTKYYKLNTDELTEDQKTAFDLIQRENLVMINGNPGTGKTYMIKKIIDYFEHCYLKKPKEIIKKLQISDYDSRDDFKESKYEGTNIRIIKSNNLTIKIAAPTGKAARRILQSTGYHASTIHKLIRFYNNTDNDDDTPILNDVNVLIIDEFSMCNVELFYRLLKAINVNTRLILIGDSFQLPPIGAGYPIRDMLLMSDVPKVELKEIVRQKEGSEIIDLCSAIKNNRRNYQKFWNNNKDIYFFDFNKKKDPESLKKEILSLYFDRIPNKFNLDPYNDVQIITARKSDTMFSAESLNIMIQKKRFNINDNMVRNKFYPGDKIINTSNNYNLNLMNGEIGFIESIEESKPKSESVIEFDNDPGYKKCIFGKLKSPSNYKIGVEILSEIYKVDEEKIHKLYNIMQVNKLNNYWLEGKLIEITELAKYNCVFDDYDSESNIVDKRITITSNDVFNLSLAYAITVHKFQGSESDCIIIMLDDSYMVTNKNWLYTAISRAKKYCIIIGDTFDFKKMAIRDIPEKRQTWLEYFTNNNSINNNKIFTKSIDF